MKNTDLQYGVTQKDAYVVLASTSPFGGNGNLGLPTNGKPGTSCTDCDIAGLSSAGHAEKMENMGDSVGHKRVLLQYFTSKPNRRECWRGCGFHEIDFYSVDGTVE